VSCDSADCQLCNSSHPLLDFQKGRRGKKERQKAAPILVKYLNKRQGKKAVVYDKFSDQFDCTAVRNVVFFRQSQEGNIYIEK
jgi:hypothetical protein